MSDYTTKDSGERAQFESGMQRDTEAGKPRFDLLIPLDVPYADQFFTRVAELLGRGAVKYEQRNWEQANSEAELARMKSSAFRHFMQWFAGETDEDHAAAVVFNLLAYETTNFKMTRDLQDGVNGMLQNLTDIGTWGSSDPIATIAEPVQAGIFDEEYGAIPFGASLRDEDGDWWVLETTPQARWRCLALEGSQSTLSRVIGSFGIFAE